MRRLLLLGMIAACGDDGLPSAPKRLAAGPVTIDTADLSLTVGPLSIDHFLAVARTPALDASHYYDPRRTDEADLTYASHATGRDGDWIVLDDNIRIQLAPCAGVPDCAALDVDASAIADAVHLQLVLPHPAGEPLFGTGDTPLRADASGTVRELQFRVALDSESGLNETHVPVPLVMWPRSGVGMLVADDRPGALDLAAASPDRVTATMTLPVRGTYRIYLYTAAAPLDLVRRYVLLTAPPAVPPKWAFAPQQWRNEWDDSNAVRTDADAMRTRHIPGSTMWIDNPWETAYNTFDIDTARFTDPAGLIADLAARGYKVLFWSTPYVDGMGLTQAAHADGLAHHYFVSTDGGAPLEYPWANGPGALVDFTAPGATEWWRANIHKVTGVGAAGWKLDYAEDVVPDIGGSIVTMELHAGDNSVMHDRYAAGYHDAYLNAFPPGEGFIISRAGAWGEQATNTAIWPGDLDGDFGVYGGTDGDGGKRNVGGLPTAIARGLGLSVSGYPFYGSDIGGFRGFPNTEVLVRWAEYAAYGTIMQLGGGGKSHDPWDPTLFDVGTDATYATYAIEHMQLVPLLWTLAKQAGLDGTPVTRPAKFVYDCACDDAMFLLGDDLLIAPVIVAGATTRDVVLPPGSWRDRATGAYVTGDGHAATTVPAPLAQIPTWARAGSLVARYAIAADTLLPATAAGVTSYATPGIGDELLLRYTPGAPATATIYDGTHATADGTALALTGGSEFHAITVDWDPRGLTGAMTAPAAITAGGLALPKVADVTACAAPGCWSAAADRIAVRVPVTTATTTLAIQ